MRPPVHAPETPCGLRGVIVPSEPPVTPQNCLFSQFNWFQKRDQQTPSVPPKEMYEYDLYSDARFTGQVQQPDWPYSFLNTVPADRQSATINTALVLRVEIHATIDPLPDMSKKDESKYHGGWFDDEIVALASLCLGVRLASGGISRRFDLLRDPYGQPVEWDRKPKPAFGFQRHGPVLPDVRGERALDGLTRLESILRIEPRRYVSLVRACSLYRDALWISESSPHLAWLLLVSALETAANDTHLTPSKLTSVYDLFKLRYPELGTTLERVGGPTHAEEVATAIGDTLQSTKKFVEFVLYFMPEPPEDRPPEHVRVKWTVANFKRMLSTVYEYRSRALHAGTPFPDPMLRSPYMVLGGVILPELPHGGGAVASSGGTWTAKDLPVSLDTFHYITRNALLKWWDSELAIRNNTP